MSNQNCIDIINYIVKQGLETITTSTSETQPKVDFVNIFSHNDEEFNSLYANLDEYGTPTTTHTEGTGVTFRLNQPLPTIAGPLTWVRLRKPDVKRMQRGGLDFKVDNYESLKKECFEKNSGDYGLIIRTGFELIEIKGVDVLVYVPNITMTEMMGKMES